jgi:uncharacterized protein YjbI with pentapeptide repeats
MDILSVEIPMKLGVAIAVMLATSTNFVGSVQAENPLHVRQLLTTKECPGCDLYEANLGPVNLRGANLSNANMYRANLRFADLREARLVGANLFRADLRGADLTGADTFGVDFNEANLCNATMPDGKKSTQGCPENPAK